MSNFGFKYKGIFPGYKNCEKAKCNSQRNGWVFSSIFFIGALFCDCGLQWLSVWLRGHRYSEARVRCGYPHWLRDMQLTQLHQANFTCGNYRHHTFDKRLQCSKQKRHFENCCNNEVLFFICINIDS